MRVEVPEFKRFCFCLPLRRGILTWAYVSLLYQSLSLFKDVHTLYAMASNVDLLGVKYVILATIYVLMTLLFAAYGVLIIVASHKKNKKLLRVSYIYGIVLCTVWIINDVFTLYRDVRHINYIRRLQDDPSKKLPKIPYLIFETAISQVADLVQLFLQGYIILLLASEILKLRVQRLGISFVNAAQSVGFSSLRSADDNNADYETRSIDDNNADCEARSIDA